MKETNSKLFEQNEKFKIEINGLEEEYGVLMDKNSELLVQVQGSVNICLIGLKRSRNDSLMT